MTDIDWKRIRPLLAKLLEQPREEHTAFLAKACGTDRDLEAQLRRIYARECEDRSFLASPFESADRGSDALRAGDHVGPYRLVNVLGNGGMGEVWLAERDGTFQQQVALKVIKRGMDTDEVVRRFRQERQLLADLQHPGIVRLLDGGATGDGRPYLALEVVRGPTIDVHCQANDLALDARLRLFAAVCEAVAAAHELGVVHRDLKPSNILVTKAGEPKVLDFGIAKVLADEGPERSLLTRTGERLLTPRYAAPEQILGTECSPATDVYSLGVILYELLCQRLPYDLDSTTLRDIESAVCEEQPKRPSRVARGTARRRLAGDLDVIVLRALAKEPERRYLDASGLARDVRRHLAHEPIRAMPDSTIYRLGKYVRRNRLLVWSTLTIVLLLALGLAVVLAHYARSERQREEAEWAAYVSAVRRVEARIGDHRRLGFGDEHRSKFLGWEWQHMRAREDLSERVVCALPVAPKIDIDPSGTRLLFNQGRELLLVDVGSGEVTSRIPTADPICDFDFSPDGTQVATAHRGAIRVHDLRSSRLVAEWLGNGLVKQVRFHPDGRRLAASHSNEAVTLRSLDDLESIRELAVVKGIIRDIQFSPSGDRLAVAAVEHVVIIGIDDPTLSAMLRVTDREISVRSVAFSPTGKYVAGLGMEGTGRVWNTTTGSPIAPPHHYGSTVFSALFLPDQDTLVVLASVLRFWNLSSGYEHEVSAAGSSLRDIVAHPTNPMLYTVAVGGVVHEWDARIRQVQCHHLVDGWCRAVSVHPDGRSYSAVLGDGTRLARVDLDTGTVLAERLSSGKLIDLAYVPHGSQLVVVRADAIDVFDGETLEEYATVPIEDAECLAISPDGAQLRVGTRSGRLLTIDSATWSVTDTVETAFEQVLELGFSTRGDQLVVTGDQGPGVQLLQLDSGTWTELEGGPVEGPCSLACSPDGHWIAVGSSDSLRVWSAQSRSLVRELELPRPQVVFPAESKRMITSSFSSVVVLDTERWDEVLRLTENRQSLKDMTLAPDGRTLLAADAGGDVLIRKALPLADEIDD